MLPLGDLLGEKSQNKKNKDYSEEIKERELQKFIKDAKKCRRKNEWYT